MIRAALSRASPPKGPGETVVFSLIHDQCTQRATLLARLDLQEKFHAFSSASVPPRFALASFLFNVVDKITIKATENEVHLLVIPESSIRSSGFCTTFPPQIKPPPLLEQRMYPGSMIMEMKIESVESLIGS